MPSQQVSEKLLEIQKELDKIQPAIMHISDAAMVAQKASAMLLEIQKLVDELKDIEEAHRDELVKILKEKIGVIESQIESATKEISRGIKQLIQLIDEAKKLDKNIAEYYDEIKKINFPERLNKIDNQISAINIGIGNLQSIAQRVQDKVETGFKETNLNVSNGVSSINKNIDSSRETTITDIKTHTDSKTSDIIQYLENENWLLKKEIKTSRIIQIIGIVVTCALLIYVAYRVR